MWYVARETDEALPRPSPDRWKLEKRSGKPFAPRNGLLFRFDGHTILAVKAKALQAQGGHPDQRLRRQLFVPLRKRRKRKCSLLQKQTSSFLTFRPLIRQPWPLASSLAGSPARPPAISPVSLPEAVSSPSGPRAGLACNFPSPLTGPSSGAVGPSALPTPSALQTPPEVPLHSPADTAQNERGPAAGTRSRRATQLDSVALPLRAYGFPEGNGQYPLQYWPLSTADLYNWKAHNPPFSENPQALTDLFESVLFSHQPTWDDCQQLLQTLLTTEERGRVLLEARKNVPGADGRTTVLPDEINNGFPLSHPDWDYNTPEGRQHLKVYRQTLMAGLRGAARRPTNLTKPCQPRHFRF
ncbi:uncharacterized protein LOC132652857 [Meriones unguiculatus]|uniref:uncharacterized protein LOC132652857 n=1 Tax=Meriones unguiculatus TaxID=10047 RepID=UPI00293EEF85|nr:uncharacterized protein LOC132652857 [Meriones unguiculatus]